VYRLKYGPARDTLLIRVARRPLLDPSTDSLDGL